MRCQVFVYTVLNLCVCVVNRYLKNLCEVLRKSETGEMIMYSALSSIPFNY
jgi:hypothetical protein